jgi:hypothetical protein
MAREAPNIRKRTRFRELAVLCAALAPGMAAWFGTQRVPAGTPISGQRALPSLVFRQYAVNLREPPNQGRLAVPFAFWNRGRAPLDITALEASCHCLNPKLLSDRKHYEPGGQGIFEVQLDLARESPGPHGYQVRVRYDDGAPREEVVSLQVFVPQASVTVTPPELYFYQLSGEPLTGRIQIEDRRGKHLKVTGVIATSQYVQAKLEERVQVDAQTSYTAISITTLPPAPAGSETSVLAIQTDDPDYGVIRVPVFLEGPAPRLQLTSGGKSESAGVRPEAAPREEPAP